MGTGIMICGLNGTGKSTLGKALAEKLHFYFIDNENLYFSGTELSCVYADPRTREEAETLLFREMNERRLWGSCLSLFSVCGIDFCSKGYSAAAG